MFSFLNYFKFNFAFSASLLRFKFFFVRFSIEKGVEEVEAINILECIKIHYSLGDTPSGNIVDSITIGVDTLSYGSSLSVC